MIQITREEVENATDELIQERFQEQLCDLSPATNGTVLLTQLFLGARLVDLDTSLRAAYHHGIRIGMKIEASRTRKRTEPDGSARTTP